MSNTPREPIMQALKATLQNAYQFRTVTRRLRDPGSFKGPDCPALIIDEPSELVQQGGRGLAKTILAVNVWVILKNGMDPNEEPIAALNNLLDAFDAALRPTPCFENFTLGDLVEYCRVEGSIEKDAGEIGKIAMAVVPLKILIP